MAILSPPSPKSFLLVGSSAPRCPKSLHQFRSNLSSPVAVVSFPRLLDSRDAPLTAAGRPRIVAGASAVSVDGFSEEIGQALGGVAIFTSSGERVLFRDLWDQNNGLAAVVLLRHFGCPCCWELASDLKEAKPRFDGAGVKLIAVGVGTPDKARMLATRLPFPMECLYADPERKAYDVLGLYYGFSRTFFNPASAKVFSRFNELREATKNYTIEATPEDRSSVLQQVKN